MHTIALEMALRYISQRSTARAPGEMHTSAPARALLCISADDVQLTARQPWPAPTPAASVDH
jgi:hypothetical protein